MFIKSEQKKLAYQMLVFDEVVTQGSFTSAAQSLGHTKSAVSHYITQLETALDTRLLNRSTRTLNLTPSGGRQKIDAIAFNIEKHQWREGANEVRIAYQLAINEFRGIRSAQLIIQHLESI